MGINIGNTGETGLFVGGENIIRDNLIFYLDPGDYNCVPDGTGNDDTVKELALSDTGNITTNDDFMSEIWTTADGAPCFTFDGIEHQINFPTIDVSEFVTGNSTTAGAITFCVWFRTSHMDGAASGGLIWIENTTAGVYIYNGNLYVFADDDDGGAYGLTQVDVTSYNDDNWHFLVGVMNNTTSTIGDTSAGACAMYIDDMITPVNTSTLNASFEFKDTNADLNIGSRIVLGIPYFYEGEIGPVMMYSDYCLNEDERIYNYNYHRHRIQ